MTALCTPGEWTQDRDGAVCMAGQRVIPGAAPDGASEAEHAANLQLIANAKHLAEALAFAVRFFDQLTPADAERMRNVLVKATGDAS